MNKQIESLQAGKWYAVGIKDTDNTVNWGGMPLYKYEGDGCWTNDDGEPVEEVWDHICQMWIPINEADEYMLQA